MPRKANPQNSPANAAPAKQAPSKKVRKAKPQIASTEQIRKLVQRRFQKQKIANGKQDTAIPPKKVKACIEASQFTCSICLDLIVTPTSLCCGHSFCLPCIQKLNKTQMRYRCCLCREPDQKDFYEVDKTVEKLMLFVENYKLKGQEKTEYAAKKHQARKELTTRGLACRLKPNDELKIKIKNIWEKGRIVAVHQTSNRPYYTIQMALSEETFSVPLDSVNIALADDYLKRMKRESRGIFSENIFLDDYAPRPAITNTYNIDELLWEVNYYPPVEDNYNRWNFSPQPPSDHDEPDSHSESVQFLGRHNAAFGRNMQEAIDID